LINVGFVPESIWKNRSNLTIVCQISSVESAHQQMLVFLPLLLHSVFEHGA